MKSFFLEKLPDHVSAGGKLFLIKTDFRSWLAFSRTLSEKESVIDDVDFIYADEIPSSELKKEAFDALLEFYQPKTDLPRPTGKSEKVLDYVIDSQLIFCAFLEQYGIDLTATDESGHFIQMHWHKFLALLSGLHNTKLNEVMSWRCWDGDTKTEYGKQMAKLRAAWELPPENQAEIDRDLEAFNAL